MFLLLGKESAYRSLVLFSCTKSGIFLPVQLVYQGETNRSHPTGTQSKNACSFLMFKAQCTQRIFDLIDENHCVTAFVPANLIHLFQPLDLAINGVAKSFLKSKFSEWSSKKIAKALDKDKGQNIHEVKVDTTLTIMKPIHAQWIISLYDSLRNDVELTKKSFKESAISLAIKEKIEPNDPVKDLD